VSDPLYEFAKDLLVPGISGLGSIAVGVAALFAARQSNALAAQVRQDEIDREAANAKERYRGQLIELTEAAMVALMDYGTAVNSSKKVNTPSERNQRALAVTRLGFLRRVAEGDDEQIVKATMDELEKACDLSTSWWVRARVAARLASRLASIVTERRNTERTLESISRVSDDAIEAFELEKQAVAEASAARTR
jgi:hypothetical protein